MAIIWDDESTSTQPPMVWDAPSKSQRKIRWDDAQPKKLSPLEAIFQPAMTVRKSVTDVLTPLAEGAAGRTPLEKGLSLASTAAVPPMTLAKLFPKQTAQIMGDVAAAPVDPTTYLLGGIGLIPSRVARAGLGAAVGGLSSSVQSHRDPSATLMGLVGGGIGSAATRMTKQGPKLAPFVPRQKSTQPGLVDFLKGNPKGIQQAESNLETVTHQFVQSLRRGGTRNADFFEQLGMRSDEAWEPMRRLSRSAGDIGVIPLDELKLSALEKHANDPEFARQITLALTEIAEGQSTIPADVLINRATDFGQKIRLSARRGNVARNTADQLNAATRSVIANAVERQAPDHLKGSFADANSQWAKYATDRDRFIGLFKPGGQPEKTTSTGVAFMKRIAERRAQGLDPRPDDLEFIQRVKEKFGVDLLEPVEQVAQQLRKARQTGGRGKVTSRVAAWSARTVAAGLALKTLLGLSGDD